MKKLAINFFALFVILAMIFNMAKVPFERKTKQFYMRQYVDYYPTSKIQYNSKNILYVMATGYSSTVDQCDADPCTAASGVNVCERNTEDVIAANFLPFNTKVRFPEVFGDRVFTVVDRMNPRYRNRVDFWFKSRQKAISFGKTMVKMEVLTLAE